MRWVQFFRCSREVARIPVLLAWTITLQDSCISAANLEDRSRRINFGVKKFPELYSFHREFSTVTMLAQSPSAENCTKWNLREILECSGSVLCSGAMGEASNDGSNTAQGHQPKRYCARIQTLLIQREFLLRTSQESYSPSALRAAKKGTCKHSNLHLRTNFCRAWQDYAGGAQLAVSTHEPSRDTIGTSWRPKTQSYVDPKWPFTGTPNITGGELHGKESHWVTAQK